MQTKLASALANYCHSYSGETAIRLIRLSISRALMREIKFNGYRLSRFSLA
jgi:hypothetical protein